MSIAGQPREPRWVDAETTFLRENYGTMPVADIAVALGRSYSSTVGKARQLGIRTRTATAWTRAEDAYLRANYKAVRSRELADRLGRPHSSVRQRVRSLGLTNDEVEAQKVRRGAIRHDYFSEVDSPIKAYVLGWMASDGYVTKNEIRLGLNSKDAQIVRLVRDELAPLHELSHRMTGLDNKSPQTLLSVSSPQMKGDLDRWGIVEAKSLIIRYPAGLPPQLDNSFILGYFDGNGTLRTYVANEGRQRYWRWQIVSGSRPLLREMQARIFANTGILTCGPRQQRKGVQAYALYTTCSNVAPVDAWLHADVPGLARKSLASRLEN